MANESWVKFFFGKYSKFDPKLLKNLDFVVVHTKAESEIYKEEDNCIKITDAIETFSDFLKYLQYESVTQEFAKIGCKPPTQTFIENFDHDDVEYKNAKGEKFLEFLAKRNERLMTKVDKLMSYFQKINPENTKEKFEEFKSHFGIDALRMDYLKKISIPTIAQIFGICQGSMKGFEILDTLATLNFKEIQGFNKQKFAERLDALCTTFAENIPVILSNTSYEYEISQKELLKIPPMTAIDEFESSEELQKYFRTLCNEDENLKNSFLEILRSDINGNCIGMIDFTSASERVKKNLIEFANIVPFNQMKESHYDAACSYLQFSSEKTKKDSVNQHIIQELRLKIRQFSQFTAKYLSIILHSRVQYFLELVVNVFNFQDLEGELLDSFRDTLSFVYGDQFERVLKYDIDEYSIESHFKVDCEWNINDEKKEMILNRILELDLNSIKSFDLNKFQNLFREDSFENIQSKSIENDFEVAKSYIDKSFRKLIKTSFKHIWDTVILKNLKLFYIGSKKISNAAGWLLKITLFNTLSTEGVYNTLKESESLKKILENDTIQFKSGYCSFFPPQELEEDQSQLLNLQGLVPTWNEESGIQAKFNSFYPLTLPVKNILLEALNTKKFERSAKLESCKNYMKKMKQLNDISKILLILKPLVPKTLKSIQIHYNNIDIVKKDIESLETEVNENKYDNGFDLEKCVDEFSKMLEE
jgi:hypothetical protein